MFNMTVIRERSHIILWVLLFVFIASMTIGGLVGGANILDVIFGKRNTGSFVGLVDGENITHRQFRNEWDIQINRQKQQGKTIDGRAKQTAQNSAWSNITDQVIQNRKIESLQLNTSDDEVYDFLLYNPPLAFQNSLTQAGLFIDSTTNSFKLFDYQTALINGTYPEELNQFFVTWEVYLKDWLTSRKLRELYNSAASISENEVKYNFIASNTNTTIQYAFVKSRSVEDSLIEISEIEIEARYNQDKDELYQIYPSRVVEYALWDIDYSTIDSSQFATYQDSILSEALLFAGEADYSSFSEALFSFGIVADTIDITQEYKNNSGFPFKMGPMRDAVRFAFDRDIDSVSDPLWATTGYAIFHILDEISGGFKPLEEVKESITKKLTREKKKTYVAEILEKESETYFDLKTLADKSDLIEFMPDTTKGIGDSFPEIGRSSKVLGTLLAMHPGDTSPVIPTSNGAVIIKMIAKDEFDEAQYLEEYDNLYNQLLSTKRASVFSDWLTGVKDKIDIEDYRTLLY
ncbi:MAG: SurA N-terminal domain-containing protein [Candidatus Marinimicrobia bacterium]|nr:SurA N-terminal domain-containing protein [Candidatus Neomarinimicrobiota bacterium]MBL7023352.1 SurA N-terminal domain-containing protein [Candidatus Neomarinimicrobiota bacterium]MBL7109311.1 SurA N-terminal domain-containing protein [Candidatus Neomarinimicrobiota bacterium]